MTKKAVGLCKLTHTIGTFVEAHLIAKALTKVAARGMPFVQFGEGLKRPIRRWSSWTDSELVTRDGEDILEGFDDWAIKTLRAHQLVWSGWKSNELQAADWIRLPNSNAGIRRIGSIDGSQLRLFFLSLLWRAAVTSRFEFDPVQLPPADIETIRQMLLSKSATPPSFYAIELIQLSTLGTIHNHAPLKQVKEIPDFGEGPFKVPIFRFYFDGLVAHIHRRPFNEELCKGLGPVIVGNEAEFTVTTVTYETSFQKEILVEIQAMAERV
jgi:hypothetical protein